jgi:hypothetical protein
MDMDVAQPTYAAAREQGRTVADQLAAALGRVAAAA